MGAAALLALAACSTAIESSQRPADDVASVEAVKAASVAWDRAHNAADLGALMPLYADAAVSMPFNRPAVEGKGAIEADFREFFAGFKATHKTEIVSLEMTGALAVERGKYQLIAIPKAGGPAVTETGKHIVVRKLIGRKWVILWEIWNVDSP